MRKDGAATIHKVGGTSLKPSGLRTARGAGCSPPTITLRWVNHAPKSLSRMDYFSPLLMGPEPDSETATIILNKMKKYFKIAKSHITATKREVKVPAWNKILVALKCANHSMKRIAHRVSGWRTEEIKTGQSEYFRFYINKASRVKFVTVYDTRYFDVVIFIAGSKRWEAMTKLSRGEEVKDISPLRYDKYDTKRKMFYLSAQGGNIDVSFEKISIASDAIRDIESRQDDNYTFQ